MADAMRGSRSPILRPDSGRQRRRHGGAGVACSSPRCPCPWRASSPPRAVQSGPSGAGAANGFRAGAACPRYGKRARKTPFLRFDIEVRGQSFRLPGGQVRRWAPEQKAGLQADLQAKSASSPTITCASSYIKYSASTSHHPALSASRRRSSICRRSMHRADCAKAGLAHCSRMQI